MCLLGLHASPRILSTSNRFHVKRIYAATVPAEMVDLKTVGNWANQQFVGEAVRPNRMPSGALDAEGAIAATVFGTQPFPACEHSARRIDKSPKAGRRRYGNLIRAWRDYFQRIAVALPSTVVLLAPTPANDGASAIRNATLFSHRKVTPFVAMQRDVSASPLLSILR
jgi:hypothetical protein